MRSPFRRPALVRHLAGRAAVLFALVFCACETPTLPEVSRCAEEPARPDALVVAGTGAALPLFTQIAEVWEPSVRREHGVGIIVPGSIGTGGAIRALRDGAIDVGLGSRPLRESELGPDVREIAYARAPLAFVANSAGQGDASWTELESILAGHTRQWRNGTPAVVVHREPGDSGLAALREAAPELADAFDAGREGALIAYTEAEAVEFVRTIPGAIAFADPLTFRRDASVEPLELVDPPEGRPTHFSRVLTMIVREPLEPRVRTFLQAATSAPTLVSVEGEGYEILVTP